MVKVKKKTVYLKIKENTYVQGRTMWYDTCSKIILRLAAVKDSIKIFF